MDNGKNYTLIIKKGLKKTLQICYEQINIFLTKFLTFINNLKTVPILYVFTVNLFQIKYGNMNFKSTN